MFTGSINVILYSLIRNNCNYKIETKNTFVLNIPQQSRYGESYIVSTSSVSLSQVPGLKYVKSATAYLNADNYCSLKLNNIYLLNNASNNTNFSGAFYYQTCINYPVSIILPLKNSDVITAFGTDDGNGIESYIDGKIILIYE